MEEKDYTSIITLEKTHNMEIIPFILRWIPHVKVMSPESLKKKFQIE